MQKMRNRRSHPYCDNHQWKKSEASSSSQKIINEKREVPSLSYNNQCEQGGNFFIGEKCLMKKQSPFRHLEKQPIKNGGPFLNAEEQSTKKRGLCISQQLSMENGTPFDESMSPFINPHAFLSGHPFLIHALFCKASPFQFNHFSRDLFESSTMSGGLPFLNYNLHEEVSPV